MLLFFKIPLCSQINNAYFYNDDVKETIFNPVILNHQLKSNHADVKTLFHKNNFQSIKDPLSTNKASVVNLMFTNRGLL